MKRFACVATVATCLAAAAGPAVQASHQSPPHLGGPVTDAPSGEGRSAPGLHGSGYSTVEPFLGDRRNGRKGGRRSDDVNLVGALRLEPFNLGVHGDVAGYKNLAFVGKWREACPGTGVDIIDISNHRRPVKIADTRDYADTSMEDMQAIRIRGRDILAIGLQDCGNSATEGTVGLELYDITDPRNPQFLSLFNGEDIGMEAEHGHVHELDLVKRRDGRVLAALASPDMEAITSDAQGMGGTGDLLLVDITNPEAPSLVSEYGVLDDPMFGVPFYLSVRQGGDARTLDHSARFNQRGTRVYLSYWDAGVIIMDIRDPANPVVLGRTAFQEGEEGNAHSIDTADRENLLIQADEDFDPFELQFTSNAFEGPRPAVEGQNTPPIVEQPGRAMAGDVVHVGRGCPADPRPSPPNGPGSGIPVDDPYLADPAGKIALIERGGCRFDNKIARAQQAGAVGVIVYNQAGGVNGDEALILMGIESPVLDGPPGIEGTEIDIPAVFVQRSTGLLLRDADPPVTAAARAVFNGWGYLRFFDISDPANPVQVGMFATPNTFNEEVALDGTWSVHNPELLRRRGGRRETDVLYASWYSDGVRVLNIKDPSRPREVAFWTGEGAPAGAPPVNIWSVVPHRRILLASDRNFGLYVLKHRGDRR
jgi:PA domain/LVIVD repeat